MILKSKDSYRSEYRRLRDSLPYDHRSRASKKIFDRIASLPEFLECDLLLTFNSFGSEVDTSDLITKAIEMGKRVLLPRCDIEDNSMSWYEYDPDTVLEKNAFGISEPSNDADEVNTEEFTDHTVVAIVPALVFDEQGNRIGYGGGYYDRFLSGFDGTSIGICFSCQLLDIEFEQETINAHDVAVDYIITDDRIIRVEKN